MEPRSTVTLTGDPAVFVTPTVQSRPQGVVCQSSYRFSTGHMSQEAASQTATANQLAPIDWQAGGAELNAGPSSPSQFITFAIGVDQYGVDIMAVREIKGWSDITHLPNQPEYVRGVLYLRGVIVPIIDLRCRFGPGITEAKATHIVIIVQIANRPVGLLADRVLDIVSFDSSKVQPVPRIAAASRVNFLAGLVTVDDTMIALMDLRYLLSFSNDGEAEKPFAAAA